MKIELYPFFRNISQNAPSNDRFVQAGMANIPCYLT